MLDSEADFKITYNNGEVMDSLTEVIEEPTDKEDHEDVLMVTVNELVMMMGYQLKMMMHLLMTIF